jgi:hypothetical protein
MVHTARAAFSHITRYFLLALTLIQVMPSVPSIAKGVSINFKIKKGHTWEGVLRLVFCVVEHDVMAGRIYQPVILQQVDV